MKEFELIDKFIYPFNYIKNMATEIVSASKSLSPAFYILVLLTIAIIASIIILIKKLNYDFKQISKSVGISLLITIGIKIILLIVSFFLPQPMCKMGAHCPSNAELLLSLSPYTIPAIFLIILLIYLIIKIVKNK
ncbi:hypothetical protein L6279_01120 [Candidatus Parcubacteria bacterium]|nr:hypothetical protein [Candidatus Parcubacteria bacterium]